MGTFLVADIGFEVIARLLVGSNGFAEAVKETLYFAAIQPTGTAMLLAPFVLLGWMSASLAREQRLIRGLALFAVGAVVLGLLYFGGHIEAQQAMQERKWTAAALSVGLLPLQTLPVLFVILVVRMLLGRKHEGEAIEHKTPIN